MIKFLLWLFSTWWPSIAEPTQSQPTLVRTIEFQSVPCRRPKISREIELLREEYRIQELRRQFAEWKDNNRMIFGY